VSFLDPIIEERDTELQRMLVHVEDDDKERALILVAGWMSIATLKAMNDFWDERDTEVRKPGHGRPEWKGGSWNKNGTVWTADSIT